ncbi:MAG: DUF5671 domain-containing protein [Parvularculaceae bacterium]|nr:DUF5671 domain-containing protein [Parvularculaceae bacterium]
MAEATLVEFVKSALSLGESRGRIAEVLKKAGWPEDQIESALGAFADVDFPAPVPKPKAYGSAREAFLLIVYFSLLGMIATQVGGLAFAWIDRFFADDLVRDQYSYGWATTGLRWSIASLLVGYPIFLFLGWRLAAKKRRDPDRRRSRVRAWLTYVTLIFAAGALIGDLVAVVYQFLDGGLSTRFAAKAGVVGLISAAILWNYSRDAERMSGHADLLGQALAVLSTIVVAVLVAWAFSVVRSPGAARERISDETRVSNLVTMTRLADCHYTYYDRLDSSFAAMQTALADLGGRLPVAAGCTEPYPYDPSTGAEYRYRVIDENSYEVCAIFEGGWPEGDEGDGEVRRTLNSYYSAANEQRTLQLPKSAGEACFAIDAVKFQTDIDPRIEDTVTEDPAPIVEEVLKE